MAFRSTALIARKSIRARLGRTIVIALAITAGVSFVVGSFVLADSLRAVFDDLFSELSEDVDLEVRSAQEFEDNDGNAREPIDLAIADELVGIEGIEIVEPTLTRYAQLVVDGDAVVAAGGPVLGVSWEGDDGIQGVTIKEGVPPEGADELAIDKATADRESLEVGETVAYLTDTGSHSGTITALIGLGDADSFGGASLVALDLETALVRFGAEGKVDAIDIKLAEGADEAAVRSDIEQILPPRTEIITGEELAEEASDAVGVFVDFFQIFLLVFALITAFVSTFIIFNIFQITIGQRLRELALLRAVGASAKQVRRMITAEALIQGVLATVLGFGGGLLVARGIVFLFNQAGAGFPAPDTVISIWTIVAAVVVGVGVALVSVLLPAFRASRIPPVAAMRPELGFDALRPRQLVVGAILTVVGGIMFLYGLFGNVEGGIPLAFFAGGGALLLFLGVASLSSTVARPVTRWLGWPVEKLYKVAGALARQNVARAPRRTSSSAAALMIGVALMSGAAVFTSSLRASLAATLEDTIAADYIVTDDSFQGLSPVVAETLADVPELDAVTPVRGGAGLIDGDQKAFGAIDPVAFEKLVDADLQAGTIGGLGTNEVLVHSDPAEDLDLVVGTTLDVTYQNGVMGELTVAGIYGDATFGNWLISLDTLEGVSDAPARDFFIIGKLADGITPEAGDAAVTAAMDEFPQANVQTNAEFRDAQEAQLNQFLIILFALLLLAVVIAIVGISITLALGVYERTHEIGLLRAVGMNRRQTRKSVRWEAVIVSTFGALVGIVLGTFLGIALSLAMPEDIIDRLAFSPLIIAIILVGAILAGLLASLYPSYKASNMDVLDAIATGE